MGRGRLVATYLVVFAIAGGLAATSLVLGAGRRPAPKVEGRYKVLSPCLVAGGKLGLFELEQSGQFVDASGLPVDAPGISKALKPQLGDARGFGGELRLRQGRLSGTVDCAGGGRKRLNLQVRSPQKGRMLVGTLGGPAEAFSAELLPKGQLEAEAAEAPEAEVIFGRLMLAIAAVILAARLVRAVMARLGQPPVMGEVLAGILLGPTLLEAVWPSLQHYLFPSFVLPLLVGGASIGLAFYMFLVGLELDPRMLRGRVGEAAVISNASVVFPLGLGIIVALPLFGLLAPTDARFAGFALFMGVSMSITAFPVLARILIERRMLKRPVGAMALSAAAIDDVTAWGLLALATAIAGEGSALDALPILGYVLAFCAGMALVVRPVLSRVSTAFDEAGQVPTTWISAIFVGVLGSAYISQVSGVAPIFGAFVMGLIMPRRADLSHDVTRRLEDFVSTVLLPLFFVVTGLRVEIGALNRPILWLITLLLIAVAIVGKWLAATVVARIAGQKPREAAVLGALMNTRGLTELIVLNIALSLHVISPALFTMLVIMALVTTFMTAPAIRLLDPRGELSAPVEEEMRDAERAVPSEQPEPERALLVAPLEERNIDELLTLAEPLAASEPPRELILARLIPPARAMTLLGPAARELERAGVELGRFRDRLISRGIPTRTAAFTSADRGADLVRLASEQEVDLILVDGRRPLLGEGVPRGDVGRVLAEAPCDVAVLVERERVPVIDADHPILVPFGGDEHDWAALEVAAWLAAATGATLRLLGSAADAAEGPDASRLLANASLAVQQLAGVAAEPVLAPPGQEGVIEAAEGAGLLVIGLSERWRTEGLGVVRSAIARTAPAPTLFVRRGVRPGMLAPPTTFTSFGWSSAGEPFAPRR